MNNIEQNFIDTPDIFDGKDTSKINPRDTVLTIQHTYDEDLLATVDTATGEVISVESAPPETASIEALADWVGTQRTWAAGRAAGVRSEKQIWQDRINLMFDADIKKYDNYKKWVETRYEKIFEEYTKKVLKGKTQRSVKMGLLILALTKTRAKTEILDEENALMLLRLEMVVAKNRGDTQQANLLSKAIKVERSILKSGIPTEMLIEIPKEEEKLFTNEELNCQGKISLKAYLEKKKLVHFDEGGEDKFSLK